MAQRPHLVLGKFGVLGFRAREVLHVAHIGIEVVIPVLLCQPVVETGGGVRRCCLAEDVSDR